MKWWKVALAILGGIVFAVAGVALFVETRQEVAYEKYRRKKEELDRLRAELDEANREDLERIQELDRRLTELRRELLAHSAATRAEAKRIREMSPEEIAHETTRLERELHRRLGLDDSGE